MEHCSIRIGWQHVEVFADFKTLEHLVVRIEKRVFQRRKQPVVLFDEQDALLLRFSVNARGTHGEIPLSAKTQQRFIPREVPTGWKDWLSAHSRTECHAVLFRHLLLACCCARTPQCCGPSLRVSCTDAEARHCCGSS